MTGPKIEARRLYILCLVFFLTLVVVPAARVLGESPSTQTSKPTTDAASIEATAAAINAQIKRVELNPDINDTDRKELIKIYNQALEQIQLADVWAARAEDYEKQRHVAPVLIKAAKDKLAEPVVHRVPDLPERATIAQLEEKLAQALADRSTAEKKLRDLDSDLAPSENGRKELPKRIAEAKQRLDEIKSLQKAPAPANETIEFRIARRTLLRAQRRAVQNRLTTLENAAISLTPRMELHQLQLQLAERELDVAKKQVDAWQNILNTRRKNEAARAAEEARKKAAQACPEVRQLALANAELAERRNSPQSPVAKMTAIKDASDKVQKILDRLTARFDGNEKNKGIKAKVDQAGVNKSISILLRRERLNLPDLRDLDRRIRNRQCELEDTQAQIIQLQEDLEWFSDRDARLAEIMGQISDKPGSTHYLEVQEAVEEQLKLACEYRQALLTEYNAYFDELFALDTLETTLLRKTRAVAEYIDEHIFWFPSTGFLFTSGIIQASLKGCSWFCDPDGIGPDGWHQVARALFGDVRNNPFPYLAAAIVLAMLLVFRHRTRLAFLRHDSGSFAYTLKTLAQTLLLAVIWPGTLFFLVWRLASVHNASDFTKAVACGLYDAAVIFLTLEIPAKMCLPNGIAERQFRWDLRNSLAIRRNLRWLIVVALPATFIIAALNWENYEDAKSSLGRLAFIVLLLAFALFMQRVLGPIRHALQRSLSSRWEGWGDWTHYVWYPFAIGIPVALAVLAAVGYYYTAMALAWRMLATLWILLGMLIVREVLLRWIFITHRHLAARRAGKNPQPNQSSTQPHRQDDPDLKGMNVHTINTQTRKLLDSFVVFIVAVALWQVWSDVLPAFAFLRELHPWGFKFTDLLLAVVILFMMYVAGRNIPGLLEITILHRLPVDMGLRFAITNVTRYIIIVVGCVVAFKTVGYGWSDIQWLIAAMTVGLSFGLQEIFANFVSGLIILFERPMRVGDVVTVGDVTGTVTRIQIRATTITDWDRKELIVPNKEFITGRVVNWTLTDRILRLIIPVGIAYGSDTELAQRLLLDVAYANPNVLRDPAPSAIFTGFGESSLNFELRAFIPNVDKALIIRHELNTAINKAFRKHGLEIPFPQQEIHVRTARDLVHLDPNLKTDDWPKITDEPAK